MTIIEKYGQLKNISAFDIYACHAINQPGNLKTERIFRHYEHILEPTFSAFVISCCTGNWNKHTSTFINKETVKSSLENLQGNITK